MSGCELKTLPGMYQLIDGELNVSKLRDVEITDLLGREPIQVNLDEIMGYVKGKVVMVTLSLIHIYLAEQSLYFAALYLVG